MCLDPISLIAMGVSAASSIVGAAGQAASYNAQSQYAQRQSEMSLQRGAYESAMTGRRNDQQLARMRGQYLSSGIALEGSASDVLLDSATQASMDEQAIRYGAKVESDNYAFQANLARMNAGQAMMGGALGALSSGINTFASANERRQQRTMILNPYAQPRGLY